MSKLIFRTKDHQEVTLILPEGPVQIIKADSNERPVQLSNEMFKVELDDIHVERVEDDPEDIIELEGKIRELEEKIKALQ